MILPPVMLPAAFTAVPAEILPPEMLPDALSCPLAAVFPLIMLPVTAKLLSVPTAVRLLIVTLLLNVEPVINPAAAIDCTPVSCDPLPMKNCPAVTLPTAEIAVFPISVPVTVAPVAVTTTTLAAPCELIKTAPLFKILMLLVPLDIPLTPPVANN